MSSSQARLLSITARLTDNEFHSQRLTNEQMKLSSLTEDARMEYSKALDSTKLMFTTFNDSGMSDSVQLTPNMLYSYQPTKNQYAISNAAGKILVTATDAANFKKSKTLIDFLQCYDSTIGPQEYEDLAENPEYQNYLDALDAWYLDKPKKDDEQFYDSGAKNELYQNFESAASSCFNNAVSASTYSGCYLHVLAHMIDLTLDDSGKPIGYPKNYTTTTGDSVVIQSGEITGSAINSANQTPNMVGVSNAIANGFDFDENGVLDVIYAYDRNKKQSDNSDQNQSDTLTQTLLSKGYSQDVVDDIISTLSSDKLLDGTATDADKLLSNYCLAPNGTPMLKTLKQKCIDLFYAVENRVADYNSVLKPIIYSFQDDLVNTFKKFVPQRYADAISKWEALKPEEVSMFVNVTKKRIIIPDKEKSQWYTNLWYRMNGSKTPQIIASQLMEEDYDTTSTYYTLEDEPKNPENINTNKYFSILDGNLATSSKWISDAVSQGVITMERVQCDRSNKENKISWDSIIYTNAIDISSEDDSSGISSAEAKYQMILNEVNLKDKRYQSMLKKLDTEHNALQTEYESVKSAMQKNIERSYKAFNG
ncbi:hypothetical protein J6I39_07485 [bacterium]|nr:hypothetical protein [bacterium]